MDEWIINPSLNMKKLQYKNKGFPRGSDGKEYASNAGAAAAAKSHQSCPSWCSPGSPVPGILQARTLEWAAISFSNAWKWKWKVKSLSHVRLVVTPWTAAYQAPPSMGFSRQECWSGVPLLQCRRQGFNPQVGKTPWRSEWQPTPRVFLSGKSHGQRNMVGYSPWGHKRVRHDLPTKQQLQNKN